MSADRLSARRMLPGGLVCAALVCASVPNLSMPARGDAPPVTTPDGGIKYTYDLTREGQRVMLKDGSGKAILNRTAATPTLRLIVSQVGKRTTAKAPSLSLTLEDAAGVRLWSTLIYIAPKMHSMQFSFEQSNRQAGTKLTFAFSPTVAANQDSNEGKDAEPVVMLFGADGKLTNVNSAGTEIKVSPDGAVMNGADGTHAELKTDKNGVTMNGLNGTDDSIHLTDRGGAMVINGQTIPITKVTRDGKEYLSFPWNGHDVLIGNGCTFSVNSDGTLIVNGPEPKAK